MVSLVGYRARSKRTAWLMACKCVVVNGKKKTSIVDPGLQDREKEGLKTKMNAVKRHDQLRNNVFLISNGPCGCVAAKILLSFLMLNNGKANTTIHVGL